MRPTTTRRAARRLAALLAACCPLAIGACAATEKDTLTPPRVLAAPAYGVGTARGDEVLWAVAPLRNETGTSVFDPLTLTDQLIAQVEQVEGVRAAPLNRTIQAMRSLRMPEVRSPADAQRLAQAMGVDAVLVGSVTAYDPYDPPTLGMALALFVRPDSAMALAAAPAEPVGLPDPVLLATAPTERRFAPAEWADRPASTASANLDAKGHGVQAALKDYAQGRHDAVSALGWRRYLASIRLYADFACYHMVERLLDAERDRVERLAAQASSPPGP